jgi:hypothetical protein
MASLKSAVGSMRWVRGSLRCCLLLAVWWLPFNQASAQAENRWLLGTGPTFDTFMNTPGINLNLTYRLFGDLHIGPDFSALLNKEERGNGNIIKRKELEYNWNIHYLFRSDKMISFYPLVGYNLSKVTVHPLGQDADKRYVSAFNLGGGMEFGLRGRDSHARELRLLLEAKYVTELKKYDMTIGILLELGKH